MIFDAKGRVVEAEFLTPKIKFVRVESEGNFEFKSGQFVNIEVAPNFYRAYSIASSGLTPKVLEFVVDITPGGCGSQFFQQLETENIIHIKGPFGRLTLGDGEDGGNRGDVCFVVTGTGIAPFRSMALELLEKGFKNKISFYWGLRYKEDIFFEDELLDLSKKLPNFKYCISLSRPQGWSGKVGHITNCLEEENFDSNCLFYLCGNQDMITDAKNILLKKGVREENIRLEKFY